MDNLSAASSSGSEEIIKLLTPFAAAADRSQCAALDWCEVWNFCSFHGVRPALSQALVGLEQSCSPPASMTADLAEFMRVHSFRVMHKTAEIVALSQALEATEIQATFFKGAVLGEQVFGGAHQREFNDIDLLVNTSQRETAADLLEEFGYRPIVGDRLFRQAFFDYAGQHMFRHVETGSVVDLHWHLVGDQHFPVSDEDVLRNSTILQLGGAQVPVPCREDLALILAGHGQKEGWASFGWALDFAKFAARYPDFDWTRAACLARAKRSSRSMLTAMLLIERLFGHVIDEALVTTARDQRRIIQDVERIIAGYPALFERRIEDDLMGSFRLCETSWQQANVWRGLLATRTIGDYDALPLPPRWWWVYRFTRPFRLVWQKIRGVTQRPSAFFEEQRKS